MLDRLEILLYGFVGDDWDDCAAGDIVRYLQEHAGAASVDVYINSGGGYAHDGLAIYHALNRHAGRITTHVDGLAASIASVIVQAGDERRIAQAGTIMIHEPQVSSWGEAEDLRRSADQLDVLRDQIAAIYAARAEADVEAFKTAMKAETWYTAEQAVAAGLADTIVTLEPATSPTNRLAAGRAPVQLRPKAIRCGVRTPSPANPTFSFPTNRSTSPKPTNMADSTKPSLGARISKFLNLKSEDDFDVYAEVREVSAERDTLKATNSTLEEQLKALQEENAALKAAASEREAAEADDAEAAVNAFLDQCVAEGKIKPTARDDWKARMASAPEATKQFLNDLDKGAATGGSGGGVQPPTNAAAGGRSEGRVMNKAEIRSRARDAFSAQ